jgi:CubicO group peptidase (beta-lactamase class C family)
MQDFIQRVVRQALHERRLVGVEVMVTHHGQTIFHQAAGYADRETQRPMTLNTRFRLASVSKPIVTTAAMVLVQQGNCILMMSLPATCLSSPRHCRMAARPPSRCAS